MACLLYKVSASNKHHHRGGDRVYVHLNSFRDSMHLLLKLRGSTAAPCTSPAVKGAITTALNMPSLGCWVVAEVSFCLQKDGDPDAQNSTS